MKNFLDISAQLFLIVCLLLNNVTAYTRSFDDQSASAIPSCVTYKFSGGRFGDNLVAYAHALWVSHKVGLPLLYRPFDYSDQLMMHVLDAPCDQQRVQQFKNITLPSYDLLYDKHIIMPETLYIVPYFSEFIVDNCPDQALFLEINWHDQQFLEKLRERIKPRFSITSMNLPSDKVTVAVHVRKGGGTDFPPKDGPHPGIMFPLKFPPDEYYIDQLKFIYDVLGQQPLYVYIFTDDFEPALIAQKYKRALAGKNIEFDCRVVGNHRDLNVLEDFFALQQFDCLVMAASNFSYMASKLGKYKITCLPEDFVIDKGRGVITKVRVTFSSVIPA